MTDLGWMTDDRSTRTWRDFVDDIYQMMDDVGYHQILVNVILYRWVLVDIGVMIEYLLSTSIPLDISPIFFL